MTAYLIDFENVHEAGLKGVEELTDKDFICIFYSAASQSLTIDTIAAIMDREIKVKCYRCEKTGKNYLDFQLATVLGMMAEQGTYKEFVIVSKDKGYESLKDFWNQKRNKSGAIQVKIQEMIEKKNARAGQQVKMTVKQATKKVSKQPAKLPDSMKKKVRIAVKNMELKPTDYTVIYKALLKDNDQEKFMNRMRSAFGKERGECVAEAIEPVLGELKI